MINAGLGVPHEYFNPIIMRQMGIRFGLRDDLQPLKWRPRSPWDYLPFGKAARNAEVRFLKKYIDRLVPRRCQLGLFAAKMHFDHYLKVLDNPVGRKLLDGGLFIHLYREDLLRQAISTHIAKETGRWGIDDTIVTTPAAHPNFFNTSMIDGILEELAEQDRGWRVFLGRNNLSAMSISYEALCKDPEGFVVSIARKIGIDPSALQLKYTEADPPTKNDPTIPNPTEIAQHYLKSMRQVWPAETASEPVRV
jgi:hypothetical protein